MNWFDEDKEKTTWFINVLVNKKKKKKKLCWMRYTNRELFRTMYRERSLIDFYSHLINQSLFIKEQIMFWTIETDSNTADHIYFNDDGSIEKKFFSFFFCKFENTK